MRATIAASRAKTSAAFPFYDLVRQATVSKFANRAKPRQRSQSSQRSFKKRSKQTLRLQTTGGTNEFCRAAASDSFSSSPARKRRRRVGALLPGHHGLYVPEILGRPTLFCDPAPRWHVSDAQTSRRSRPCALLLDGFEGAVEYLFLGIGRRGTSRRVRPQWRENRLSRLRSAIWMPRVRRAGY